MRVAQITFTSRQAAAGRMGAMPNLSMSGPCRVLALSALALLPAASAQVSLKLPANYLSRFSSTELAASTDSGFGVRYFPLPFGADWRLSVVRNEKYVEYNVSTRQNDTTYAAGVYSNGYTAEAGIPTAQVTHDPWRGVQYGALLRGGGASSRVTAGYALTALDNRVRVLNNVGVAVQGDLTAPYTQSEAGGSVSQALTPQASVRLGASARLFTFPAQGQAQGSVDLSPGLDLNPAPGVNVSVSHFERQAVGSAPVGDLNYGDYRETSASAAYRLGAPLGSPQFGVAMLRSSLTRSWTGETTALRGDVLLRAGDLPSLLGPSIGYQWGKTPESGRWLLSLTFAPR